MLRACAVRLALPSDSAGMRLRSGERPTRMRRQSEKQMRVRTEFYATPARTNWSITSTHEESGILAVGFEDPQMARRENRGHSPPDIRLMLWILSFKNLRPELSETNANEYSIQCVSCFCSKGKVNFERSLDMPQ